MKMAVHNFHATVARIIRLSHTQSKVSYYHDKVNSSIDMISLASSLLIIPKSLNTNRFQVQAQLSHTRPI